MDNCKQLYFKQVAKYMFRKLSDYNKTIGVTCPCIQTGEHAEKFNLKTTVIFDSFHSLTFRSCFPVFPDKLLGCLKESNPSHVFGLYDPCKSIMFTK